MPITKQSIKRVRRDKKRTEKNSQYKNYMKSMIKLLTKYIQEHDLVKAQKIFKEVVSAIDTGVKKNMIHKNNAAHKKSRLQKALNQVAANPDKKASKSEKKVKKKHE